MSLSGRNLGPYEIGALIGAGGMGEVYRATDTRLGRTVAIKVLPAEVTASAERKARFEREARAIAALSHPHICAVFDVGSSDGIEYLVMEYLEGETLAERIARGPLPVSQVVRYGTQIAEALHHAHRAGITHRDLKPGNVLITGAGAKLLDFGLAKSIAGDGSSPSKEAPTQVVPITSEGTIVGTVQYMSPEQLEGKLLDARTDIFSLGVVLYEMASGVRPFNGASSSAVIASILRSDPASLRGIQPALPPALERIVATALEKDRDDRWQTAHDVARQLAWITDSTSSGDSMVKPAARRLTPLLITSIVLLAAALGLAGWAWARLRGRSAEAIPTALEFTAPPGIGVPSPSDTSPFAISPDGRSICFVGTSGGEPALYVRDLSSYDATRVEGSEEARGPFWSSDGHWIAFAARGKLWKVRWGGHAPPEAVCDVALGGSNGTWVGDTIMFTDAPEGRTELFAVSAQGGQPRTLVRNGPNDWRFAWPYLLPDGKGLLYLALARDSIRHTLVLADVDGKKKGELLYDVSQVRLAAPDRLIYVKDGRLLTQQFDAGHARMIGEPETVATDIGFFYPSARANFDAVPSGTIVYRTSQHTGSLVTMDRNGQQRRVVDTGKFYDCSVSPDGLRAAVTVIDPRTGLGDIWIYDLIRGVKDRFTTDPGMEFSPVWSADGRSIFYASAQGGSVPHVVHRGLESTAVETVTERGPFRWPSSATSDGRTLYLMERNVVSNSDIYRAALDGGSIAPVLATQFSESEAAASPDGRLLAYSSDASGSREVYVQSTAPASQRIRVSSDGGGMPRWSRNGRELFHLSADGREVRVATTSSGNWSDATVAPLLRSEASIVSFAPFDGDRRIVYIDTKPGPRDSIFNVILNGR